MQTVVTTFKENIHLYFVPTYWRIKSLRTRDF